MAENAENSPELQENNQADKPGKKKAEAELLPLPILVEFGFSASVILLLLVDLIVAASLILSGASLLDLVIRTSVTTLVLGSLLMLLSWQLSTGMLNTSLIKLDEVNPARVENQEAGEMQNISAVEAK